MTLALKQLEGKYEILSKIQEGGMGSIYKVRHLLLDEIRVIKVIRPQFADDESLQQRFVHEARTAIRLRHPNIAQLYDFASDELEGSSYMVMEYIDGVTLKQMLNAAGPPSVPLAVEIARQGLLALSYLHHHGFVHRDIAPDNLMLGRDFKGAPVVKLIDLGIAKRLGAEAGLTRTGMFLGKVRYTSPEQLDSDTGEPDHRSDLYSYGVLLYELLTGRCPFPGEGFSELVAAHLFKAPLDFSQSDPADRVAPALRQVVLKTLEKGRDDRYASADELISALEPFCLSSQEIRDELAELLATASKGKGETLLEPGSTQSRLDRQFGREATPQPGTPLPEADSPLDIRPAPTDRGAGTPVPDGAPARIEEGAEAASASSAEPELEQTVAAESLAAERAGTVPGHAEPRRKRRGWRWAASVVILALGAVAVLWYLPGSPLPERVSAALDRGVVAIPDESRSAPGAVRELPLPPAPGTLVFDALPWAEVVEIRDAAGSSYPVGAIRHTPLRLSLPAGTYTLAVTHPRLAQPREIVVEVRAGETLRETVPLAPADADAYLERAGWLRPAP